MFFDFGNYITRINSELQRNSIVIVCGKPSSGKTTYIKKVIEDNNFLLYEEDIEIHQNLFFKKSFVLEQIDDLPKKLKKNHIYESRNFIDNSIVIDYPSKESKIKYISMYYKNSIENEFFNKLINMNMSTFDFIFSCETKYIQEIIIEKERFDFEIKNPDNISKKLIEEYILKRNSINMLSKINIYDKFRYNTNYSDILFKKLFGDKKWKSL